MWPRRDGRGDLPSLLTVAAPLMLLQCGRGAMAAVTGTYDAECTVYLDSLQCGRGAMAAVTSCSCSCSSALSRFNVAAARWPR